MAGNDLKDKVILVIGGSGGLGSALVEGLNQRGAQVLTAGRSGEITLDIRDSEAGDRLVSIIAAGPGRLDGVINASGVVAFGPLADTPAIVIEELFLTNVMGPLWLLQHLVPLLSQSQGFVVTISGVVAETPMPHMVAYSASKAALAAAVVALRKELRRSKIRVIDARPPHTETGLATRPLSGSAPQMAEGLTPQRVAERIIAAIESGQDDIGSADF
jgi:cyclic-di-GMP-binding biofilm dispersal mediator protein